MGLPARFSHRSLGGNRTDVYKVTDPKKQVPASVFNAIQWQVAGMNRTCSLVTLTIAADGSRVAGAEAWNDQDDPDLRVTITHDTLGQYQISCESPTYPDETGTEQAVEFHGAIITPTGSTSVRPPTFTLDSPTQITVYTWNGSGSAADCGFTIDIK